MASSTSGPGDLGEPKGRRLEENPKYLWTLFRTAVDSLALNTGPGRDLLMRAKPYPDPFIFTHLEAHAGAELGAWVGMRNEPAPLVIVVPGTFITKDAAATRSKAVRLYRETNSHVCALDLRGFGHSSATRSTGGYLEAYDIGHIARSFAEDERVTHIVLAGESLGAAVVMLAAVHAPEAIDGVLAINPHADLEWAVRWIADHPPRWHPFHIAYHAFRTLLRHVTGRGDEEFDRYIAKVAAGLGMTPVELSYRASPRFHLGALSVPTLVLHAVDDPIVPVFHAHTLRIAAQGNDHVRVHLTASGGHTHFELVDSQWYWETVAGFLREVCA